MAARGEGVVDGVLVGRLLESASRDLELGLTCQSECRLTWHGFTVEFLAGEVLESAAHGLGELEVVESPVVGVRDVVRERHRLVVGPFLVSCRFLWCESK